MSASVVRYVDRLNFGVALELLPLMQIRGMKRSLARSTSCLCRWYGCQSVAHNEIATTPCSVVRCWTQNRRVRGIGVARAAPCHLHQGVAIRSRTPRTSERSSGAREAASNQASVADHPRGSVFAAAYVVTGLLAGLPILTDNAQNHKSRSWSSLPSVSPSRSCDRATAAAAASSRRHQEEEPLPPSQPQPQRQPRSWHAA